MPIDVERLRTECAYQSQAPVAVLSGELDEIGKAVQGWTTYRRRIRYLCIALLFAGAGCIAIGPVWGALAAFAAAIAGFVYAFKYARGAITHLKRCETLKKLVATFADDAHPKSPVSVKLSLQDKRELLKEAAWSRRKNGKEKYFTEPWLSFEMRLLDGTNVSETVTDLIRVRTFTNPRGKSKTKTRTRHIVALRFAYPAEVYGDLRQTGARLKDPIKLPDKAHLKGLGVTEHDVKVKVRVDGEETLAHACSMASLGAYRMMNLGRRIAVKQGGGK